MACGLGTIGQLAKAKAWAMATPIVCETPVTSRSQEEHLVLERVSRERPAMAEHNGLA